ncbi:MAG: diguanylate cyclase, partial [Deltaproteobacteria bacterium]|nr:diguanylate cyclase [Deltaproteobacteria bacterium]
AVTFGDGNVVWVCGPQGLWRFDGKSWSSFGVADGLRSKRLMNVTAASDDEVWVGYEEAKGVTRLVLEKGRARLTHFGKQQGLLSDTVWMLERDPLGRVWAGGSDGVSVILPDGTIRGYDQGDGLIWNDIAQGGFGMDVDGAVFIGTSRGLAYHDLSADKRVSVPPNVVLTSIALGSRDWTGEQEVEVAHDQGTFTASFSGLAFHNPSQVRFEYQLVGLDSEPITTKQREVRYPALAPGAYRFEVKCRSAAGIWSTEPATFSFSVLPPWWERWWARLAALVAIVLLALALLQFRTRRLEAERHRLEVAVEERSAQLAEANQELREMSFTDALTRVRNRRFFATIIESAVASTMRRHDPRSSQETDRNRDLVFYMVDLDHFKKVNDVHGHMVGDKVLVETAKRLEASLRQSDLVVRWGGEEFLLVCSDAERGEADRVARRILEEVGGTPLIDEDGLCVQRTCSLGWVALPAFKRHPELLSHEVLIEVADQALYMAKKSGRNQAIGVEFIEEEFATARSSEWLDQHLDELEGKLVKLTRIDGPFVDLDPITTVSSSPPPWRRKSAFPNKDQ